MPRRILIVDDHPSFRSTARMLFESEGYEVVGEAADGAEAIGLAQALQPDIVLLDVAMPQVNGLEALPRIKAERPETKIIMVTVHDEDAYRRAAAERGADAFLLKKTLTTTLLPTIQHLRGSMSPPSVP
jgi:DNA-binding NarL/FixJ family response regulator